MSNFSSGKGKGGSSRGGKGRGYDFGGGPKRGKGGSFAGPPRAAEPFPTQPPYSAHLANLDYNCDDVTLGDFLNHNLAPDLAPKSVRVMVFSANLLICFCAM